MDYVVATLLDRVKWVNSTLQEEVAGLTPEQLAYVPAPETNSIAVLVTHTLGSERHSWSVVAGKGSDRDRPAEFAATGLTAEELIDDIDRTDRLIEELAPLVDRAALERLWERPGRESWTGIHWLITNFGHAREHLAHLQLTKQLRPDRYPSVVHPWI